MVREKNFKRCLKNKVGITFSLMISLLITSTINFAEELSVEEIKVLKKILKDIKDNGNKGTILLGEKAEALKKEGTPGFSPSISSNDTISIGNNSSVAGDGSIAIGKNALTGQRENLGSSPTLDEGASGAVAIGQNSRSITAGSIALGNGAEAGYKIGFEGYKPYKGIAIGDGAIAGGYEKQFIGSSNLNELDAGIAIGHKAQSQGTNAIVIGSNAQSGNGYNILIGANAKTYALKDRENKDDTHPQESIGLGGDVSIKGYKSIAIGGHASVGRGLKFDPTEKGNPNIQDDFNGVSIGYKSNSERAASVSLGSYSNTKRQFWSDKDKEEDKYKWKSNVIAPYSEEKLIFKTFTLNNFKEKEGQIVCGVVSVGGQFDGKGSFLRQIINLADGTEDTDAVNLRQLRGLERKLSVSSGQIQYFSIKSDETLNKDNKGAKATNSIAIGPKVKVNDSATNGLTLGYNNEIQKEAGIAIGNDLKTNQKKDILIGNKVTSEFNGDASIKILDVTVKVPKWGVVNIGAGGYKSARAVENNKNNLVIGNDIILKSIKDTYESGTKLEQKHIEDTVNAVVLGNAKSNSKVLVGSRSIIIGQLSESFLSDSIAIGNDTISNKGIALGNMSKVKAKDGVAIGTNSLSNVNGGVFGESFGVMTKEMIENKEEELKKIEKDKKDIEEILKSYKQSNTAIPDEITNKQKELNLKYYKLRNEIISFKSTGAAISVGNEEEGITRQIINLAAGTKDTDAVNVAQLRAAIRPITFFINGNFNVQNKIYTPSTENSNKWSNTNIVFGSGLKAEKVKDSDNNEYTRITLDSNQIKDDSNFKGEKGDKGEDGKQGEKGKDGLSAYEVWKKQGNNGTEQDFLNSLKGKDGKDGKGGVDFFEYAVRIENKDTPLIEAEDGKLYTKEFLDKNEYRNNKWFEKGTNKEVTDFKDKCYEKTDEKLVIHSKKERIIANVKAGVNDTDVVNVSQLNKVKTEVTNILNKVEKADEKANLALGGVSNAIAMANLPQVMGDNKFNLSASYGYYGSTHALAIGFSGTNEKQNFVYKLSGAVNSKGNLAFGAGFGIMIGKIKEVSNEKVSKLEKEFREYRNNSEKQLKEYKEKLDRLEKLLK